MPSTRTVVSLTPLAVEADSRTFKQAASIARLGYRSIVLEGVRSRIEPSAAPFELISVEVPLPPANLPTRALFRAGRPGVTAGRVLEAKRNWRIRSLAAVLEVAPAADLYWVHSYLQAAAAARLSGRSGGSFVYDAHDLYSELTRSSPDPDQRIIGRHYRRLEAEAVHRAAATVTVSPGLAERHLEAFGRRPFVIKNAWDTRLDRPSRRELRSELNLDDDALLAVVVGNAKPPMAIDALVAAVGRLPEHMHLAFVGAGFDRFRSEAERVHIVPPVPPFEVSALLAGADLGIVAYRPISDNTRFCLPNGFFHVVAAGLPLVYCDLPDLTALCREHAVGRLVPTTTSDDLARCIAEVAADPRALEELRLRSVRAREVLNWEHEERTLSNVLDAALLPEES